MVHIPYSGFQISTLLDPSLLLCKTHAKTILGHSQPDMQNSRSLDPKELKPSGNGVAFTEAEGRVS